MGLCDAYMGSKSDAPPMADTSIRVSEELADELYNRKGRGTSYEEFLWELLERVDQSGEAEGQEDIAKSDSSEEEDALLSEEEAEEAKESVADLRERDRDRLDDAQDAFENEAEEILRDLDSLSGSGSKYEARVNAVLAFYEHLRDHAGERVSRGDLKDLAEDSSLDLGYASFTSLWNNWVKANESQGRDFNTLAQLPGVEMDGDDYVYKGEIDGR